MPQQQFKILLLEDEEDINLLWVKSLTNAGYQVDSFLNGSELIKHINHKADYDLAILDIMVPGINGLEVTNYIHIHYPDIYIIILSSKEDYETISSGFEMGAHEYLKKPCPIAELKIRIQQIIKKKTLTQTSKFGKVEINNLDCSVKINNKNYLLSNTEYKIFLALLKQNGKPIKKTKIINLVWGIQIQDDSRLLELNIHKIRNKINKDIIKSSKEGYYINEEII